MENQIKVVVTFTHPLLGTAPGNPELYEEFIGAKSADKDAVKEELASLSQVALEEKGMTVFPRTADGCPMLWDYQVKGFIKEMLRIQTEFSEVKLGKHKMSKWTVGRIADNFIFVSPREIPLRIPAGSEIDRCVRPLRASTLRGERIALACSERAPVGTSFECCIEWLHPGLEECVRRALDFGSLKGIGQWRNSGMGRFTWSAV